MPRIRILNSFNLSRGQILNHNLTAFLKNASARCLKFAMGAKQGFRRWPLKEGPCLSVYGRPKKIVCSGIADVELDRGIEFDQLHQIRAEEGSLLVWWLLLERLCAQLLHRTQRCDMEADLLREAELQQSKKKTTKAKMETLQEIHMSRFT